MLRECSTCQYWTVLGDDGRLELPDDEVIAAECHRYLPLIGAAPAQEWVGPYDKAFMGRFPNTYSDCFCGEWTKRHVPLPPIEVLAKRHGKRAVHVLTVLGISTVESFLAATEVDFLNVKGCGHGTLVQLRMMQLEIIRSKDV